MALLEQGALDQMASRGPFQPQSFCDSLMEPQLQQVVQDKGLLAWCQQHRYRKLVIEYKYLRSRRGSLVIFLALHTCFQFLELKWLSFITFVSFCLNARQLKNEQAFLLSIVSLYSQDNTRNGWCMAAAWKYESSRTATILLEFYGTTLRNLLRENTASHYSPHLCCF